MTEDLGKALRDLTAQAAVAARPVDVDRTRSRLRRRRARGVVVRSTGALVAVGAVVAAVVLVGGRWVHDGSVTPVQPATPTSDSARLGTDPCGVAFAPAGTDDPDVEVQGAVLVGVLAPDGGFETSGAGDTLLVEVGAGPDVPTGPLDTVDRSGVTTVLVGPDGTVAFWTDPDRQEPMGWVDGVSAVPDGVYPAVDCRTGDPLTGTYRAYATTTASGHDETVELAPVALELGGGQLAGYWPSLVPVCGRPAPAELLAGEVDADLDVALDPGADLTDVPGGIHLDVTLTATGTNASRLVGRLPQGLHAVLVDSDGTVVSQVYDPTRQDYDSGTSFDVGAGGSFSGEVYQWFASCPDAGTSTYGDVAGGEYDLYVYSVVLASTDPSTSPAPRIVVGGPYPVTLR